MAASLQLSRLLVGLDRLGIDFGLHNYEQSLLRSIDFSNVLMQGMFSLLLFAGALHVDLDESFRVALPAFDATRSRR